VRDLFKVLVFICGGCGGSPAPDSRLELAFRPAAHRPLPQVVSLGGPVMRTPHIVPVFFGADPLRPAIEAYLQALGGSDYWTATTAEYGVAPFAVEPSIVVSIPAPMAIHEATAAKWLHNLALQSGANWPPPDRDTLYAIYPPAGTPVSVATLTDVCAGGLSGGGFHASAWIGGIEVPFAIAARCPPALGSTPLDVYSATMSHELVEAVTDPLTSAPAYAQTDEAHAAFQVGSWGEVCDLCELAPRTEFRPAGLGGLSQRCWSNAAAAAGHDPCVPAIKQPYFNAIPVLSDPVSVTWGGFTYAAEGVRIPLGGRRTIDVDLFSDTRAGDFSVEALDYASIVDGRPPALDLSLDRGVGNNGTVLQLTIKVLRADTTYGGAVFFLTSRGSDGTIRSYSYGIVGP
jgi:hypothetical protein